MTRTDITFITFKDGQSRMVRDILGWERLEDYHYQPLGGKLAWTIIHLADKNSSFIHVEETIEEVTKLIKDVWEGE